MTMLCLLSRPPASHDPPARPLPTPAGDVQQGREGVRRAGGGGAVGKEVAHRVRDARKRPFCGFHLVCAAPCISNCMVQALAFWVWAHSRKQAGSRRPSSRLLSPICALSPVWHHLPSPLFHPYLPRPAPQVGCGGTSLWKLCTLAPSTTLGVVYDITAQHGSAAPDAMGGGGAQQFFLQFLTRYLHYSGTMRCRVTTITRRWVVILCPSLRDVGACYQHAIGKIEGVGC